MRKSIFALLLLLAATAAQAAPVIGTPAIFANYKRTAWTVEDGAPTDILALAQTKDGYLWLAGTSGLYRFDGVKFESIPPRPGASPIVTALLATRSGELWAGHYWGGLSLVKDGKLVNANAVPPHGVVERIVEDGDGALWVATDGGTKRAWLLRNYRGVWDVVDERWGVPHEHLSNMAIAKDGTVWVALKMGMLRLRRGERRFSYFPADFELGTTLAESPDGTLWVANGKGVRPFILAANRPAADASAAFSPVGRKQYVLLFDREGNLWNGGYNCRGVALTAKPSALLTQTPDQFDAGPDGQQSPAESFLQDREGNIWVGTAQGLLRYHPVSVTTLVRNQGLAAGENEGAQLIPSGNVIYGHAIASSRLFKIEPGAPPRYTLDFGHTISLLSSDHNGGTWIGSVDGRFEHLVGDKLESLPMPFGLTKLIVAQSVADSTGRLWVALDDHQGNGLVYYEKGRWSIFPVGGDYNKTWPWRMVAGEGGSLWVYYGTMDLLRIAGDRVETIWHRPDATIGLLNVIHVDKDIVWLGGETGLAIYDGKAIRILSGSGYPMFSHVDGIAEAKDGKIWLIVKHGVLALPRSQLLAAFYDPGIKLKPQVFDLTDGMPGPGPYSGTNAVAGKDGRIWFVMSNGIAMIDPEHLLHNPVPPPVLIRGISVGDRNYPASNSLSLPRGTSSLRIDYTATSLSIPERVQFRYRLQDVDPDWIDAGNRRQAFYTNLGPGTYTFRVIAANNDGVWNTAGATTSFTIPPTFLQSYVFKALVALLAIAAIALLIRLRVRYVERHLRSTTEARMTERERIARELHDTLLQGFQALVLRFQNILDQIPKSDPSHQLIEQELERADAVIVEGRNRVRDLRSPMNPSSLEHAFADAATASSTAVFTCSTTGTVRDLHPVAGDEIAKIGIEAVSNAAKHAAAGNIEVRISYRRDAFVLRVLDDGVGIDSAILEAEGRAGHYGLIGMRERASRIRGRLVVRSVKAGGTTVELTVPGAVAYASGEKRDTIFTLFRTAVFGEQHDVR